MGSSSSPWVKSGRVEAVQADVTRSLAGGSLFHVQDQGNRGRNQGVDHLRKQDPSEQIDLTLTLRKPRNSSRTSSKLQQAQCRLVRLMQWLCGENWDQSALWGGDYEFLDWFESLAAPTGWRSFRDPRHYSIQYALARRGY